MVDQALRMTKARTRLLLDSPWFGALSLRLLVQADSKIGTLATDGTALYYDPAYVQTVNDRELVALLAHEVMHCALLHPYRIGGRDLGRWNIACDLAINPLLTAQGFTLPDGMLDDPQYHGLPAEVIYARLPVETPSYDGPGQVLPGDQPGEQPEDAADAPGDSPGGSGHMTAADWQIASEQAAMVARKAGAMPGDVDRELKEARRSRTDWRTILRRFIEQTVPSDYSWTQPNRRYISQGLYLPGVVRENMPALGIAIDTSGSVDPDMLARFAQELTAIMHECRPERIDVVYCDSEVRHVETFSPDDGALTLHPVGGGGTRFQPALDWFADREVPAAVIYLTDLEGPAPMEPEFPVLWATPLRCTLLAPFGELVRVS